MSACNFIKKRLWHRCFPIKFAKFLRKSFLQNTSGRLLLFRINRVSDYYAKSIYIKVFPWIIVLWMLVPSKILTISENTSNSKFFQKYLLQVRCRSSAQNFTRRLILLNLFYTFKNRTPSTLFLQTHYF